MSTPTPGLSRRDFIRDSAKAAVAVGAAASLGPLAGHAAEKSGKLKLAMVGTGHRGTGMWGTPVVRDYSDRVEFVGLCDINPKRAAYAQSILGQGIPTFTDFDQMVKTTRPDKVIVTTVDSYHAHYVNRAMELGCDVLCEKPLCTDAEQAQSIVDGCRKSGRHLDVTFNARYGNSATKTKELLLAGEIGELYAVDYAEFLNLSHGADYYRRWHAFKSNSGTLLCHKASHHFDQLNWWIGADPVEVTAIGRLNKYGRNGPFRHANCRACTYKDKCEFYWDITKNQRLMDLYVKCESEDGYYRDGCVYRSSIDIYDRMSAQFQYDNRVQVSYTLDATVPYEGQHIVFTGSKGRIEVRNYQAQPWQTPHDAEIRLTRNFKNSVVFPIKDAETEHGGADVRIRDMVFKGNLPDPLGQRAGMREGIMSSLMGISSYTSIETGGKVKLRDLVKLG